MMSDAHGLGIIEAHGERFASIERRIDGLDRWRSEVDKDMAAMQPTVEALRDEVWNHEGTKGVKTILNEFILEMRIERDTRKQIEAEVHSRRWKRPDKIAVAAILAVMILPPAAYVLPPTIIFFRDLYGIAQEYEKVHKTEIQQKGVSESSKPAYAENSQQDAGLPAPTERNYTKEQ
jgi:hypothetical protein